MNHCTNRWMHRFSCLLAGATFVLIVAGANVTSHRAGLAVPDWPTTYGQFMFSFPISKWVGNILYEHGHRLIASTVGMMTIVLAFWLVRKESRRWVRILGIVALAAVIAQGVLGGLTVKLMLPPAISIAHAGLAEIFFSLTIALALFTSAAWQNGPAPIESSNARRVRCLAAVTTLVTYLQILLGAAIRHAETALLAHIVGAVLLFGSVVATFTVVWLVSRRKEFVRNATFLLALVTVQIALGVVTLVTRLPKNTTEQLSSIQIWLPTAHLAIGALILATSLTILLKTFWFLAPAQERTIMPLAAGAVS